MVTGIGSQKTPGSLLPGGSSYFVFAADIDTGEQQESVFCTPKPSLLVNVRWRADPPSA